jgi:hypothetical protein
MDTEWKPGCSRASVEGGFDVKLRTGLVFPISDERFNGS